MVPNKLEPVRLESLRLVLKRVASDRSIPARFMLERLELCKKDFFRLTPVKSIFLKSLSPKLDAKKSTFLIIVLFNTTPSRLEY